jgi:hypothetical protein
MDDNIIDYVWGIIVAVLLIGFITLACLQPKFKAETYARLTGKHVTYWDAVWCDLRIQEQVK